MAYCEVCNPWPPEIRLKRKDLCSFRVENGEVRIFLDVGIPLSGCEMTSADVFQKNRSAAVDAIYDNLKFLVPRFILEPQGKREA